MAKDIFDIILEKDFHQLNSKELAELGEYCKTEEEFLAMKQVLTHSKSIADGPKLSPREETKEKLNNLFDSTYGRNRKFIPFYLNPMIHIAAVLVVGFAVWIFFRNNTDLPVKVNMAENSAPKEEEIKREKTIQPEETNPKGIQSNGEQKSKISSEILSFDSENELTREIWEKPMEWGLQDSQEDASSLQEEMIVINSDQENSYNSNQLALEKEEKRNEAESSVTTSENISYKKTEEAKSKGFQSVSAPAASVKDISVDASKSPFKTQASSSVNVASQRNVMNYLTARY